MNGTVILLIIVIYFAFLMLISHLTGRKSDNDTFFFWEGNNLLGFWLRSE